MKQKNKNSHLVPTSANVKDSKQLLHYAENAMESESFGYDSDINEHIIFEEFQPI